MCKVKGLKGYEGHRGYEGMKLERLVARRKVACLFGLKCKVRGLKG